MAVLLLISSQRICHTAELHSRISDNDFTVCRLDNIHEFLQSVYDDVFRRLRASVYTFVSELAVLCRRIFKCSGKLLNLRHLCDLHLHSNSAEALSMSHHGFSLLNSIWGAFLYAQGQVVLSWSQRLSRHQNLQNYRHPNYASRVRSHYFFPHAADVIRTNAWYVYKSWAESFGAKTIGVGETIERENDHINDAKSRCWHAFERDAKRLWFVSAQTSSVDFGLQLEVNVPTISYAQHERRFDSFRWHCWIHENVEHENCRTISGNIERFVWEIR